MLPATCQTCFFECVRALFAGACASVRHAGRQSDRSDGNKSQRYADANEQGKLVLSQQIVTGCRKAVPAI
jgi:hypothetical protein